MIASPLHTQLVAFVDADDDEQALIYLQSHRQTLLSSEALTALAPLLEAETDPGRRLRIQARRAILQAALTFHHNFQMTLHALSDQLITWVQTSDWNTSEVYLQEHADDLLTDQGELALRFLCESHPDSTTLAEHLTLLQHCRETGLAEAYAELRRPRPSNAEALPQLMRTVFAFVQADSDAEARALLDAPPQVLLTEEVERLLEGLIQTAHHQHDETLLALAEARLTLWREIRRP